MDPKPGLLKTPFAKTDHPDMELIWTGKRYPKIIQKRPQITKIGFQLSLENPKLSKMSNQILDRDRGVSAPFRHALQDDAVAKNHEGPCVTRK